MAALQFESCKASSRFAGSAVEHDRAHRTVPSLYSRGLTIPLDALVTGRVGEAADGRTYGPGTEDPIAGAAEEPELAASGEDSGGSAVAVALGVAVCEGVGERPGADDPEAAGEGARPCAGVADRRDVAHADPLRLLSRSRSKPRESLPDASEDAVSVDPEEDSYGESAWDPGLPLFSPELSDEPPGRSERLFWAEFLPGAVF
jgi:hypothetical protein